MRWWTPMIGKLSFQPLVDWFQNRQKIILLLPLHKVSLAVSFSFCWKLKTSSNNEESCTFPPYFGNLPISHAFQPFSFHSLWVQLLIFDWKQKTIMYNTLIQYPFMLCYAFIIAYSQMCPCGGHWLHRIVLPICFMIGNGF